MLAVFLVGGRTHAADGARGQRRLQQIGGVHRAAGGGAGADHGVDFVDEQDGVRMRLELLQDLLQPLLEIAAIAGAREQRAHVEREHGGRRQHFRHFAVDDALCEAFGDRGLADAGFADEQRIVLLPAAQHLDGAVDLGVASDHRIDLAVARLLVEVDAVSLERLALLLGILVALGLGFLVDAAHRARLGNAGPLGNAVADVIDRVVTGHVLLLQEIGGMALALGEDRDQHVGAGHFLAAGRLDVDHRALDHALESGGRLGVVGAVGDQIFELGFEIVDEAGAQLVEIDAAGAHHGRCIRSHRSATAEDVRASHIGDDARLQSPAHDAGIVQGFGKKSAFASSMAPGHHDRRCPVRQQQPLSYSHTRSRRKTGSRHSFTSATARYIRKPCDAP